jgi:hypothetical protein
MKVIFPYFESGLPLRSRDLNAIYRRADEDVRNTRTCLQGMGIFYGVVGGRCHVARLYVLLAFRYEVGYVQKRGIYSD